MAFAFSPAKTTGPSSSTLRATRVQSPATSIPATLLPASDAHPASSKAPGALATPQRRVQKVSDFSPFALRPSFHLESEKKPTYAILTEIDPGARLMESRKEAAGDGVKLSALPAVAEPAARKRVRGEDEGIGVSPRKKVPARYTGLQPSAHDQIPREPGPDGHPDVEVTVVFPPLPNDASRLGVEPRAAAASSKPCEAGLWAPWSELQVETRRVIFASRYLVAHVEREL
ncbi:hypothetical protein Q5752_005795 [Cryptotrichosporon argae]